jgi:hypothetical protein
MPPPSPRPLRSPPGARAALIDAAGRAHAVTLAAVARARRAKPVHPVGQVYDGVLEITGGAHVPPAATLLASPARHGVLVRFSRSVGLPKRLPDLFGIAIRLPDVHGPGRHQDFLTVTSVDAPLLHHLFVPVRDPQRAPYSSSLPYRAGSRRFLVGVEPMHGSPRPPGRTVDDRLERAAATGQLRFAFSIASLFGRFKPVGELRIGHRPRGDLSGLRFNPWNTGGGLEPAGVLNGLRAYAYPASQAAWLAVRDRTSAR